MNSADFKKLIAEGIPSELPPPKIYDREINHAPRRKDILSLSEKRLAIKNALRYFPEKFHQTLVVEFARELAEYGRIYMYRLRPDYEIKSRHMLSAHEDAEQQPCRDYSIS